MHFGYWDETTENFQQALDRENQVVAEVAGIGAQDRVLDAGCGIGGSAIYLGKNYGCRVTGITLSEKQVESATGFARDAGVADRVDFRVMDYLDTSFEDGSFQVTWAMESACHASDKDAFVQEMGRLLAPGGRLVMADGFTTLAARTKEEKRLMDGWLEGWCVDSLAHAETLGESLRRAGFTEIEFQDISSHVLASSRRLHRMAWPFLPLAGIGRYLGRNVRVRALNIIAMVYQYRALQQGLWQYGILSAKKPS